MQRHVSIPVGHECLTGELYVPEREIKAVMLFCHGWTSKNMKYLELAERLSKMGILSFAINLRGHGDSTYLLDSYSRQNHLDDIVTAIDYVKKLHSDKPLILMGKSYGGYLSALASTIRRIDYLIVSQPALYPDADFTTPTRMLIKRNPNIFRSMNELVESNRALRAISHFKNPLLIIESEHDEEVGDVPKLYVQASANNKLRSSLIIKNTDHPLSRPEWLADYYARIVQWVQAQNIA